MTLLAHEPHSMGCMNPVPPATVETLRRVARRLRLHPADGNVPLERFLQRLEDCMDRRLVFYAPRTAELSFDEAWLLRLFTARRTADAANYRFALQSRLSRERASEMHFLVCQIGQALDVAAA